MADPYKAIADYFDIPAGDRRVYAVAKKLIDQGIDPAEWVGAQMGGPMPTRKEINPVDPRGMRTSGRMQPKSIGGTPTGDPVKGEQPRHYNPTEDEMLGLDEGMREPGALISAAAAVADPKKRREFERGISDTMTLGLAEKGAKALAPLFGDNSFSDEQAAQDAEDADGYRAAGAITGAVAPAGLTNYIGKQGAAAISRLAGLGKGPVLGAGLGVVGGAATAPVAAGVSEAGKTAIEAPFSDDVSVADIPRRSWDAAKMTATDPTSMVLAGAAGGLGGLARGIRDADSQTGEDLRLVEAYGGKPSLTKGAKGGAFDQPALRSRRGTSRDEANVAEEAMADIRGGLRKQGKDLQANYGEGLSKASQGELVDLTDEVVAAVEDVGSRMSLPKPMREKLAARVMAEMGEDELVRPLWQRTQGRMMATPKELHDLRQRWDLIAKTGEPGEDAIARGVAERLRTMENKTGFGPLNEEYASGIERLKRGHELLGMGNKKSTKPGDAKANTKGARRLRRGGQNTSTTGHDDPSMAEFLETFPEFEQQAMAPRLMAAKGRLTPSLSVPESGNWYSRLAGLPERNMEPLLGGVVRPLGEMASQGAGIVPQLRNPMLELMEAKRRKNEDRADGYTGRFR